MSGLMKGLGTLVLGIIVVSTGLIGLGGVVSVAESPFGVGPLSTQGSYCNHLHAFAQTLQNVDNNPNSDVTTFMNQYKQLIQTAPDGQISASLTDWLNGQTQQDHQIVNDAATKINGWNSDHCNSPAMAIPRQLDSWWGGIVQIDRN